MKPKTPRGASLAIGTGTTGTSYLVIDQFVAFLQDAYPDMPDSLWPFAGTALALLAGFLLTLWSEKVRYPSNGDGLKK